MKAVMTTWQWGRTRKKSGGEKEREVENVKSEVSVSAPWRHLWCWAVAALILNFGTRLRWLVSVTSRSPYVHINSCLYPLNRRLGEPHSRLGRLGEEINFFSFPRIEPRLIDFPVRSLVPPTTTLKEMAEDKKSKEQNIKSVQFTNAVYQFVHIIYAVYSVRRFVGYTRTYLLKYET